MLVLYRLCRYSIFIFKHFSVYTDWFQSDGGEESVDHEVDFLCQVRHPEVLQQRLLAAQTVDQHTEPQPAQADTQTPSVSYCVSNTTTRIEESANHAHCNCNIHLLKCCRCLLCSCWISSEQQDGFPSKSWTKVSWGKQKQKEGHQLHENQACLIHVDYWWSYTDPVKFRDV